MHSSDFLAQGELAIIISQGELDPAAPPVLKTPSAIVNPPCHHPPLRYYQSIRHANCPDVALPTIMALHGMAHGAGDNQAGGKKLECRCPLLEPPS